ncbi:MAG: hypothetical protein ACAH80_12600, partial [Alphaproteobacteria bacterium]
MSSKSVSIRNILLLAIGSLSLLVAIFTLQQAGQEVIRLGDIRTLKTATIEADKLFDATEQISVERDIAFFALHSGDGETIGRLAEDLREARAASEKALPEILKALRGKSYYAEQEKDVASILAHTAALKALRAE